MSGPKGEEPGDRPSPDEPTREVAGVDPDHAGDAGTGQTDYYSRAYSAPESEQFVSAPYVPADSSLYDYDSYDAAPAVGDAPEPPRWPWVVAASRSSRPWPWWCPSRCW
jgi:hypothetical protein